MQNGSSSSGTDRTSLECSASSLVLEALEAATEIQAAGRESLLALAARALDPEAPATRAGIGAALGLCDSLVLAILTTADALGDTESRRELARRLFAEGGLVLSPRRAPLLSAEGQLATVAHGLAAARALDDLLGGLLAALGAALAKPEAAALDLLEARAVELQRTKIVPIERSQKSKLGVPAEEAIRRRAAQAVRATVQALREPAPGASPHLAPTVAGELAASLALQGGVDAGAAFLLSLAGFLDGLPNSAARRPPGN